MTAAELEFEPNVSELAKVICVEWVGRLIVEKHEYIYNLHH